ncbi:hypothetical protein A9168_02075 [Macellibacteroides sp. HH-ZS]|nr:hypothetical protein A9168_02075 [Macellibacteroides sp. HH-ZS]
MSFYKKLYYSPLGYFVSLIQHALSPFCKQIMVYGFYNHITKRFYRGTRISSSAYITEKHKLNIGDNVWINHNVRIDASGGVTIGEGCQIGYNSMILSHSSHMAIRLNGSEYVKMDIDERIGYIHNPVSIGDYTFIGGGSAVMPGINIGRGCVVGVNSVVTKDVPDYAIVAGSPARIIGSTLETDLKYFENNVVKKHYYDKSLLR